MTSTEIRAVHIERTASLDDSMRAMIEVLIEIAAQLAEQNERGHEADARIEAWRNAPRC